MVTARALPLEEQPASSVGWGRLLWETIKRKPLGAASAALIAIIVLTAIFADVLAPYDPLAPQPEIRLSAPSRAHPFGTDDIGRDVLSRIIYGARISLWVGLLAVGIGTAGGMVIGLACGYWEGRLDLGLQRVMDAVQAIPGLVLALAIVSVLKPNTTNAMLAIAMVIIPGNSRIVRGAVLAAKQNRYVEAAQALGCQQPRIVITHILPNVTAPILIIASIWLGNAILIEASLSFLGLGTQPPTPVLGADAEQHRARLHGAGALAGHLPGPGHQPGRAGLQPLRRHAARRLGPQAPQPGVVRASARPPGLHRPTSTPALSQSGTFAKRERRLRAFC